MSQNQTSTLPYKGRVLSVDVYRGMTMFFMASAGFGFTCLIDNPSWSWLARQFMHTEWEGMVYYDLIQPCFMFIVGVAMPFAFAIRAAKGQAWGQMVYHAFKRSLMLLVIGIAIRSMNRGAFQMDLTTVLQQIAIAYFISFFVLGRGFKVQLLTTLGILVLHWALFQFWPGVGPGGPWAKNANFGSALDYWWLGRFDGGGYLSINALSSTATMIIGVMAGERMIKHTSEGSKVLWIFVAGLICLAIGLIFEPWIPLVKRIWTPSWAVFCAGWALVFLAAMHWVIEVKNWRSWTFIFKVVGMNSITIYVARQLMFRTVYNWQNVFTGWLLDPLGDPGHILQYSLTFFVFWYVLYWMYQRKIYLKVG